MLFLELAPSIVGRPTPAPVPPILLVILRLLIEFPIWSTEQRSTSNLNGWVLCCCVSASCSAQVGISFRALLRSFHRCVIG